MRIVSYECEQCGHKATTKQNIQTHRERKHKVRTNQFVTQAGAELSQAQCLA